MRAEPTASISGSYYPVKSGQTVGGTSPFDTFSFTLNSTYELVGTWSGAAGIDTDAVVVFTNNTANYIEASAEL